MNRIAKLLTGLTLLFLLELTVLCLPAEALLRQHHEASGNLQYHSQYSWQDRQGSAWQVVLFPEERDSTPPKYYLRLVGFPGLANFKHPHPLEMLTSEGKIVIAKDAFSESAPASNVGQYDITSTLVQVKGPLTLSVPLQNADLTLTIPKSIVTEWQWLVEQLAK